jgi:DNA (cytosine-5)-methyltransferase 1
MNHASLFSGIGGFDLAAQWMGWQNIFQCEIDSFCQKLLTQNFPNTARYGDIKQFDGTPYRGTIDIISGGFPCQPFSVAGKQRGTEDERHLWPEMLRIIREIQPRYILGENVGGIVSWGKGLVFEQVQADLEAENYTVQAFVLPACAINAPHRRDRVWFIAYSERQPRPQRRGNGNRKEKQTGIQCGFSGPSQVGIASNPESIGLERNGAIRQQKPDSPIKTWLLRGNFEGTNWTEWPTQSRICGRNDGIPNRMDRIKALGNAVVPQLVYLIFKQLEILDKQLT